MSPNETTESPRPLLAFYGDDFTGSTDALEFLTRSGARSVLFIEAPEAEELKRFGRLDAFGVAGMTRALPPEAMEAELRPAFARLRESGARHVHYKVCSTFDSSPTLGSIGRAIDVGAEVFRAPFVPLLVAAPALGRYCAFGNLFARAGIGSGGAVYRLDRHPTMSRHPRTPMDEADLRRHLGRQTSRSIALLDLLHVSKSASELRAALVQLRQGPSDVVLFDALNEGHLRTIGEVLDGIAGASGDPLQPLFSVGSSGVEMALGLHWEAEGRLRRRTLWPKPASVDALLVVSGSCSPVTAAQIEWSLAHGFEGLELEPARLLAGELPADWIERSARVLRAGTPLVAFTSKGAQDTRIQPEDARLLATAVGEFAREVAKRVSLQRVLFAGGDTSGGAARACGITAVEMISPLVPGAPLCRATAPGSPLDGLEVNFKGGQVGPEDYFELVRRGANHHPPRGQPNTNIL